jgi:rod shape determining protein RodA
MSDTLRSAPSLPGAARRSRSSVLLGSSSRLWQLDWILLAAVGALCAIGTLLVWAATEPTLGSNSYLYKSLINIVVGGSLALATAFLDQRQLRAWAPVVYGVACLGLVAVMVPGVGATINGSHSWIPIAAGFQLQPSEFAKLAVCPMVGVMLGENRDPDVPPSNRDVLRVLVLCGIPMGLIMLEPNLGSMMVFVFMLLGLLGAAGTRARWLLLIIGGCVVGSILMVQLGLLKSYQVHRFTAFLNPSVATQSYGYNTTEARITIGSGGLFGTGLFHGPLTNGHFVPENQTDFVFTVAGEELGFVGSGAIILLSGVVLWRGIRIASRSPDLYGAITATGIVSWLAFQAFENIGMTLGIMPVVGLPLPFVSYGGSSMFANLVAIGLLQNIHLRNGLRAGPASAGPTAPLVAPIGR